MRVAAETGKCERNVAAAMVALLACALAGCGGSQILIRFPRRPLNPVVARVGEQVAANQSVGACWPPLSSNASVLAAEQPPPRRPDCTPHQVLFNALSAGLAVLDGQLPCHGTGCLATHQTIVVIVEARQSSPLSTVVPSPRPIFCFPAIHIAPPGGPVFDARALLGLPEKKAMSVASRHGCTARVVEQDGHAKRGARQPLRRWIDLAVDRGFVTSVATNVITAGV